MSDLILHHYPMSPFAEKVRLILGFKQLPWRSVLIPPVMPKPDVVALTGGYRKTPVLQIGADIYCDTALIARLLESIQPSPSLFPASAPLAVPLAQWADFTLFWAAAAWTMQPAGAMAVMARQAPETIKAFGADRAAMTGSMRRLTLADATVQLRAHLAVLSAQLDEVERYVAEVQAAPSRTPEQIAVRLRQQIDRLLSATGATLDPARLHQEAVLIATRIDVEEELKRLGAHIAAARDLLAAVEPVGRKFDFLTQEFNREANTLCSKGNDLDVTRAGLALKTLIDQMREQVQNIE